MDHAQLVHEQWTHAAEEGLDLHVLRVATDDNIADLPSRRVFHCSIQGCVSFGIHPLASGFRFDGGEGRRASAAQTAEKVLGTKHLGSVAGTVATVNLHQPGLVDRTALSCLCAQKS